MTVADLIRRLQAAPQDAPVLIPGMRGDYGDNYEATVDSRRIALELAKFDEVDGGQWRMLNDLKYEQIQGQPSVVVVIG